MTDNRTVKHIKVKSADHARIRRYAYEQYMTHGEIIEKALDAYEAQNGKADNKPGKPPEVKRKKE